MKKSDVLISRINESLSSYTSAGIIDSGKFYSWIKHELRILGNYNYNTVSTVLEIENSKSSLPEDFILLEALYLLKDESNPISKEHIQRDYKYLSFNEDGNKEIKRVILTQEVTNNLIKKGTLLKPVNKIAELYCNKNSVNYNSLSGIEFNVDSNYIYTSVSKGELLLVYLNFPLDEDGLPLIPDDEIIEESIEMYIMYKIFEYFYINDITNNALQKMQYYKEEYRKAHKNAEYYVKLPTYESCIESAYNNREKFNIFENGTRKTHYTSNRYAKRY